MATPDNKKTTLGNAATGFVRSLKTAWSATLRFFQHDIWERDLSSLPRMKKAGLALVRIVGIVLKGFHSDECTLQASALTYFTLMSMVPVLALSLSVAKGFEAERRVMELIGLVQTGPGQYDTIGRMAELPPEAQQVAMVIFNAVEQANFGALGAVGLAFLFWAVIKVMAKIENTFNLVWGVHEPRPWLRKISDYISVFVLVPVMVLLATSVNAVLSSDKVTGMLQQRLGALFWLYEQALGMTGLLFIFLAFIFLYMFMPNTRVRILPAAVGGVIGGTLWYVIQTFYFMAQSGLTQKNVIYGTFAAIPFFLLWVYMSWLVVLFGAELAFAVQNCQTYTAERKAEHASVATRQLLGMLLVYEICRNFYGDDEESWDPEQFSAARGIPIRLVTAVLSQLTAAHVVLATESRDARYVPAKDIGRLTLGNVETALFGAADTTVSETTRNENERLYNAFNERYLKKDDATSSTTFRELIEQDAG